MTARIRYHNSQTPTIKDSLVKSEQVGRFIVEIAEVAPCQQRSFERIK